MRGHAWHAVQSSRTAIKNTVKLNAKPEKRPTCSYFCRRECFVGNRLFPKTRPEIQTKSMETNYASYAPEHAPSHCSCNSSESGNWEVSLVLKSWMFYACVLFAPVGLDWGVMYGYVTSWSGDPFAGKLRPSQHLSKAMHLDGERHVSEGRRLWFLPPGSRCVVKRSARL